jgi:hypothetical protein
MKRIAFLAAALFVAGLFTSLPTPIHAEQTVQSFRQDCTRAGGFIVEITRPGTGDVYRLTCHYPDGGRSNCSTLDIDDAGAIVTSDSTCATVWNERTTSLGSAQPSSGVPSPRGKTTTIGPAQR